jgi:acylglycerol lipase
MNKAGAASLVQDRPVDRTVAVPADASAMLLIIHGLAEHRGRYAKLIDYFTANKVAVCTVDLRGHGTSPGVRGDVVSFHECVNDLAMLIDSLKYNHPTLALFIWGHSMGAVMATRVAAERSPKIRGVITSGAPFAALDQVAAWRTALFKFAARYVPTHRIRLPIAINALSRDAAVIDAYRNDPLIPKTITLRLLVGMIEANARALRAASKLRMPWLALHGGADRIAPPIGSQRLIDALASADTHLTLWPDAYHEVHNDIEPDRSAFLSKMVEWIAERSG